MAKTNWQDPNSGEILSTHISGLQEAVGKIEKSIGIGTVSETAIPLSEVFISNDDRCRIYQAPDNKRNWVISPAPVIKKNGTIISSDFVIDYGGGAVVFTTPLLESDVIVADATYTTAFEGKQLSTENYSLEEKNKLEGIEPQANKYIHPDSHPASMIVLANNTDVETKINEVESAFELHLSDYKYLGVASAYGVSPSIGTADATVVLNNYFAALKAKGLKYAFFDKPHTYIVSGVLVNARDLILIGNGAKIKNFNLQNYYIRICNTFRFFDGKYNDAVNNEKMFNQIAKAIKSKSVVNITLWGDSISTANEDLIGINYSNAPSFVNGSPNGLTASDAYFYRLVNEILSKFKDVTFNFYNRSIGGLSIYQWNENRTIGGVTKGWIEFVKDTNPDLLIVAFGMNTSFEVNAGTYYYLQQINEYIKTNFSVKSSVEYITAPRCVLALESPTWGDYAGQFARDQAAYITKNFAIENEQYVIDVNKVTNIKRTGTDFDKIIMREMAINDSQISSIISGTYTKVGNEYILDNLNDGISFNFPLKDFILEFDFKATGVSPSSDNLYFSYNIVSTFNSVMLIQPNLAGAAVVSSYSRVADISHYLPKVYNDPTPWSDSVYRKLRLEKRGNVVEFSVNGKVVLKDRADFNNLPGFINMRKDVSEVGSYTLSNFKLYSGDYVQYLPTMTETEMWGQFIDGDYGTKPDIGGNGVNHPSNIGLDDGYCPAIKEFVYDLASAVISQSKGIFIPVNVPSLETPGATTTSGAQLKFFNVASLTYYPEESRLQNSDGTYWVKRTDVKSWGQAVNLLDGEFAAYNDGGVTQVALAKTNFTSVTLPLKFWSWQNP